MLVTIIITIVTAININMWYTALSLFNYIMGQRAFIAQYTYFLKNTVTAMDE